MHWTECGIRVMILMRERACTILHLHRLHLHLHLHMYTPYFSMRDHLMPEPDVCLRQLTLPHRSCISGYARLCMMTQLHRSTACHVGSGAAKLLDPYLFCPVNQASTRHPTSKTLAVSNVDPSFQHIIAYTLQSFSLILRLTDFRLDLSLQFLYISFLFSLFHTGSSRRLPRLV